MKKSYQLWCFGLQAAKIPTLTSLTNKPTFTCLNMKSSEKMGYRAEWFNRSVMSLRTCFFLVSLLFLSNSTPLQYSCLESPMDGGAWRAAVHGVAKSRTQLSDFIFTFHFHTLEKEMATHSSNPRDGGAWWAAVYGVAQSRTWLKWRSSSRVGFIVANNSCGFEFHHLGPKRED